MQVILLENIRKLGKLGETVSVKSGFARNYLVPYGKAVTATKANVAYFEERRHELELKANALLEDAASKAEALKDLKLELMARASDEGKLYGSIGTAEIKEAIKEKANIDVAKKDIVLSNGPIRAIGEEEITIQLHDDISTNILVIVEAEVNQ